MLLRSFSDAASTALVAWFRHGDWEVIVAYFKVLFPSFARTDLGNTRKSIMILFPCQESNIGPTEYEAIITEAPFS